MKTVNFVPDEKLPERFRRNQTKKEQVMENDLRKNDIVIIVGMALKIIIKKNSDFIISSKGNDKGLEVSFKDCKVGFLNKE